MRVDKLIEQLTELDGSLEIAVDSEMRGVIEEVVRLRTTKFHPDGPEWVLLVVEGEL